MPPPTSWHWSYVRVPTFDPVRNDFIGARETSKQSFLTYCKACLQIDIQNAMAEDDLLVQSGLLPQDAKRSAAQIEFQCECLSLNHDTVNQGFPVFEGKTGVPRNSTRARVDMINIHFTKCNNIDPTIKALALGEKVTTAQRKAETASANAGVAFLPSSSFGPPSSGMCLVADRCYLL